MDAYLADHPSAGVRSFDELVEYSRCHAEEVMHYFQQEFFEMAPATGDWHDARAVEVRRELRRLARTDGIDKALADHRLDTISPRPKARPRSSSTRS